MRLIDADKLIKSYRKLAALKWNQTVFPKSWADAYESFIDDIEEAPTIQPQGIDKDRLIEELKHLRTYEHEVFRNGYCEDITCFEDADVIRIINQQPTTDGWIPVSERLPEEDGKYLCTDKNGFVSEFGFSNDLYSVDNYYFNHYKGKKKKGFYKWSRTEIVNLTAWQPLPQPYKESEGNEER